MTDTLRLSAAWEETETSDTPITIKADKIHFIKISINKTARIMAAGSMFNKLPR
jgi:hypothetical protein